MAEAEFRNYGRESLMEMQEMVLLEVRISSG
jgi:hypothetical protein